VYHQVMILILKEYQTGMGQYIPMTLVHWTVKIQCVL